MKKLLFGIICLLLFANGIYGEEKTWISEPVVIPINHNSIYIGDTSDSHKFYLPDYISPYNITDLKIIVEYNVTQTEEMAIKIPYTGDDVLIDITKPESGKKSFTINHSEFIDYISYIDYIYVEYDILYEGVTNATVKIYVEVKYNTTDDSEVNESQNEPSPTINSSVKTPISTLAIILTLIAIPIIVLRKT